ncbi:hypothetical protein V6N11_075178 [Hibiscus sabdariffa]|uniref:Uncharacterized protein n=1 Tax=Hibiscus sabdariffa TaxID=183260 RepID=A0ABR2R5Q9_9ROSI
MRFHPWKTVITRKIDVLSSVESCINQETINLWFLKGIRQYKLTLLRFRLDGLESKNEIGAWKHVERISGLYGYSFQAKLPFPPSIKMELLPDGKINMPINHSLDSLRLCFKTLMLFRVLEVASVLESLASMILDEVSLAFWLMESYSPSPKLWQTWQERLGLVAARLHECSSKSLRIEVKAHSHAIAEFPSFLSTETVFIGFLHQRMKKGVAEEKGSNLKPTTLPNPFFSLDRDRVGDGPNRQGKEEYEDLHQRMKKGVAEEKG